VRAYRTQYSMQIKPFCFDNIKKLTRHEVALENALLNYLPYATSEALLSERIENFLSQQLNCKAKIALERIEEKKIADWLSELPERPLVFTLGVQPVAQKAWVWVDSNLAFSLIDRSLGGFGELPTELKALTSIEEGVLSYLALKTLHELYELFEDSSPIHWRIENFHQSKKDLATFEFDTSLLAVLRFRVQVGSCVGFVILALPHPFIEEVFLNREADTKHTKDFACSLERFSQLAHVQTSLWVEIGNVSLTLSEKNQLEKGDIILFDQSQSHLIDGKLVGNSLLRVGEGKQGAFLTQIVSSDSPALVKIIDYYGGE